jgi:O-antigen ligase
MLTVVFVFFYFWMLICFFLSPYKVNSNSLWWFDNYWKYLVFYFLMIFGINDFKDLKLVITGFVVATFLYQIHSWLDFMRGGSYVYQQGIKRMVGTWSGGGIGAANAFGLLSLFPLPLTYFLMTTQTNKRYKYFFMGCLAVSILSVMFCGTRAAMAGVVVFIMLSMKYSKNIIKVIFVAAIFMVLTYFILPESLKSRYFSFMSKSEYQMDDLQKKLSEQSAHSRIEGLFDGWKLAMQRPITGYGPGASPVARLFKLNKQADALMPELLQLHNLYGQVPAETGIVGFVIFLMLIMIYFAQLKAAKPYSDVELIMQYKKMFRNLMLLWLYYGFASHTLFRINWFVMFTMQSIFIYNLKNKTFEEFNLDDENY